MNTLLKVSLRQQAVFIPSEAIVGEPKLFIRQADTVASCLAKCGYGLSQSLWSVLQQTKPACLAQLLETVNDVMGLNKNWTPLVKGWDHPTGESLADHIVTFIANLFEAKGTKLACGHIIPPHTFPLERYNGCPYCGTPFEFGAIEYAGQASKLKMLELWKEEDVQRYFESLLTSGTVLNATQMDSLKLLLTALPLPSVGIKIKETRMAVIDVLTSENRSAEAQSLFTSPADIMRYLWYKHTGFLQIIEPATIIARTARNNRNVHATLNRSQAAKWLTRESLKLKYSRRECMMVAGWINNLEMSAEKICEVMHPKRAMWVRFIRALRLAEYAKRKGFEKLRSVLDLFYREAYSVWQGKVEQNRMAYNARESMNLLKQRPGLFARSLFANLLWFGSDMVTDAFEEVIDKVPARLLLTLDMYAPAYFDKQGKRVVRPLGGTTKNVPVNHLVQVYEQEQLDDMKDSVRRLCELAVKKRFASVENTARHMYIDPMLFRIPLPVGDRSHNIQDIPEALPGTRFPVEGRSVRLFMQWGNGLRAQHLDMDLSCRIVYERRAEHCSFSSLAVTGCLHSGDIRYIPEKVGTAEYIEIDLDALQHAGAKYVVFTCNAYSNGSIAPNLVVGWMDSRNPMKISEKYGVAYDPSCVQHQVRIVGKLEKGLVFGVLDVVSEEIIWLEMPFGGQLVQHMDMQTLEALVKRLGSKITIGGLLQIKADAQHIEVVDHKDADEVYTEDWARNAAEVTRLLIV